MDDITFNETASQKRARLADTPSSEPWYKTQTDYEAERKKRKNADHITKVTYGPGQEE